MKGIDIYNYALKHLGEKYVLGVIAPKDDSTYKGPWDCAEFASYIVGQVTGKLYGCSDNFGDPSNADAYSGFWGRDAGKLGTKVPIAQASATPGAFLLRLAGKGLIGHIVCSNGKGGTVEAHSTKTGVITSTVTGRRWDFGILVPWVDYETASGPVPHIGPGVVVYRYIHPNPMKGPEIKVIQKALNSFGAQVDVDGIYGQETFNAVKGFQYAHGLTPDGEVGPKTIQALGINLDPRLFKQG